MVSGFTEVLTLTSDVMILQENTLIILTLAAKVTLILIAKKTPTVILSIRAEHFNFIVQLTLFIMDTEVSEEHLRHT